MSIAIIGCGYIGSKLAEKWSKKGHLVTATTRSPKRLEHLGKIAQKAIILKGSNEKEILLLMKENDVFVVTVAADSPDDYENAFLRTAQSIRHAALEVNTPKILFYTSRVEVYGDQHGLWVDESSNLLSKSKQGKILIETENTFLSLMELGWKVCIFRVAEIYGPERSLSDRIKRLQGNRLPGTGGNFTNMVHNEDVIKAIDYSFNHSLEGIFNLSDNSHPTRKDLYDEIASKLGLSKIDWDATLSKLPSGNKRVSNHKIKAAGYNFIYPERILE